MTIDGSIGGFLPLELPNGSAETLAPAFAEAIAFRSGRACLRAALEVERPRRLFCPFYVCDSVLDAARDAEVPVELYSIDEELRPTSLSANADDAVLVVDYFGLGRVVEPDGLRARVIFDDTQAFFARRDAHSWSFSSARKWFGVADGAFLRGPRPVPAPVLTERNSWAHLIERRWGDAAAAYRAYVAAEESFDTRPAGMSAASRGLLVGVDFERVQSKRRRNFARLHAALGQQNALPVSLRPDAVPFIYPFLPRAQVPHAALHAERIFVARYWAECETRAGAGFGWERSLARGLLPLPIDHRYGDVEMDRVIDVVQSAVAQGVRCETT